MHLSNLYKQDKLLLSFELFPPKTDKGMELLKDNFEELVSLNPGFMTCTYGAGGSTRQRTLDVLHELRAQYPDMPMASHLTCVGSTKDELREYLKKAQNSGVNYIVALRGDPPAGEETFKAVEGGLHYANELVSLIKDEFPHFDILVAGYPETHQEATSPQADLDNLKRKVDAGADVILSQLFFNNEDFYRWQDKCDACGIQVPIVPGIFPVLNLAQIRRITDLCGASLPDTFVADLEKEEGNTEGQFKIGVEYSIQQVKDLIEQGVPGIHYYVLNKSRATAEICNALHNI